MRTGINKVFKSEGKWEGKLQELCKTKLYYATCQQRVWGQNKDYVCLHAARTLRAKHTLIWRSCAFNRRPMTMPVLDGPMTMPVLDGVKPMAITLPICGTSESLFWKRKKSIYCWTRSRPTWTFGESDDQVRDKSESKYQRVQDKSETIEKRLESGLESETGLEYYSPTLEHKTSHKGQFCETEIYASSESWINNLSIDVWFVSDNIWLRYNYL